MIAKCSIEKFKEAIKSNLGKNVSLTIKKGRRLITLNDCILENAYSCIFVVRVLGESLITSRHISVCYADLLTGNARLSIVHKAKEA